jgi:hypothetical protein
VVEVVAVIKRVASGVVAIVVVNHVTVMPIKSPMMPAPAITSVPADSESLSKEEIWAAIPNSWIRIPARPRHDGLSVNQPRIVRGDVNDIGAGRFNTDGGILLCYGLLLRGLKIAGFLCPPAHHLYCINNVRLLIVVGVA